MGKAISSLTSRPIKNFNVENRAQSVILKDKPIAAPRHPSTVKYLDDIAKDNKFLEEQKIKPEELLERLKAVTVADKNPIADGSQSKPSRSLPQITKPVEIPNLGFVEPEIAIRGKITLSNTLEILMNHQRDPEQWNAAHIATKYKIDLKTTQDILEHYKLLTLEDLTKALVLTNPMKHPTLKLLKLNESENKSA